MHRWSRMVILCMITSKHTRDAHAISITQADFAGGGLPRESNVRPNRLFTADCNIILRTTGMLTAGKIDQVVAEIINIISS